MSTRITLIRHGETDWNISGRWQGQAPVPLNANGLQQAMTTASFISMGGIKYAAVYASDLSRAYVTASLIVSKIGGEIVSDKRLREIDLGDWQGLTEAEVKEWDAENFVRVRKDLNHERRPGGESWQDVGARAVTLLEEVVVKYPSHEILMTSHGGTIRSILSHFGLLEQKADHLQNCARTIIIHTDGKWTLEGYNLTDHLIVPAHDSTHSEQDAFDKTEKI